MANNSNTLSAKLEVKDSFTSALNKFSRSLNSTETAFNKFVNRMDTSSNKIEKILDGINAKMDSTSKKIVSKTESVVESINKSTQKTEQQQKKLLDELTNKYTKFGSDVTNVFKDIQQESNKINPKVPKKGNSNGGGLVNTILGNNEKNEGIGLLNSSALSNSLKSAIGGNFMSIASKLGVIGVGVMGVEKLVSNIVSSLDNLANQGFNTLNTLSTGLLSVDGLKEGLQEAGQFQNNRVALNTLYKSDEIGQKYYQIGTKAAKKTPFSESEVGELQKKLSGANVNYSYDDLLTILDMASVKPELGASHAGFSITDAMAGRSTSLKTNYMIDNKEVQAYLKKALSGQAKDKTTGQKVNASKWKDAFNSKGSVNNKQEYLELLISYIRNQTNYNGLTEKYAGTINGQIDRLKGNWETLKADLLGIDANGTGMMKPGQVTVFSAVKKGLDSLDKWLDSDKSKQLLNGLGQGLGSAIESIADAMDNFIKQVKWDEVGQKLKQIGDSVAQTITKLTSSPQFMEFINNLPNLIDRILGNKAVEFVTNAKYTADMANGHYFSAENDKASGWIQQKLNLLGLSNPWSAMKDSTTDVTNYSDALQGGIYSAINSANPSTLLSDSNIADVLAKNTNINDNERKQIKDMVNNDNISTYNNITIGTIQADNFEQIMDSIKKAQNNK